ncbi:hypothetical protein ACFQZZ_20770 [Nocardia sp. GCM10030253]|uniref:hypothetical protein n=1 Tax=Nocardia sp. GCM10030253 TaxID=3273404 RepID=UPI0036293192
MRRDQRLRSAGAAIELAELSSMMGRNPAQAMADAMADLLRLVKEGSGAAHDIQDGVRRPLGDLVEKIKHADRTGYVRVSNSDFDLMTARNRDTADKVKPSPAEKSQEFKTDRNEDSGSAGASTKHAPSSVAEVRDMLRARARPGEPAPHWEVDTVQDMRSLYEDMSRNGEPMNIGTYPGKGVRLADGTEIRIRDKSVSGGVTMDLKAPGERKPFKVHLARSVAAHYRTSHEQEPSRSEVGHE